VSDAHLPPSRQINMIELAQRLKRIRIQREYTLEDVASRAGLTRGWLSKVENFRVTPSLPALANIAGVLGVSLSELFEGLDSRPPVVVIHQDQRVTMKRDEDVSMLEYESLAHSRPSRNMDPFVIKVPRADQRPMLSHAGEEFMYVLKGSITLEYGTDKYQLEAGDSAYFDGEHPHRMICVSDQTAEVIVVYHGVEDASGNHQHELTEEESAADS
jgi:transcriptional regulator with XRE-family HTH domain